MGDRPDGRRCFEEELALKRMRLRLSESDGEVEERTAEFFEFCEEMAYILDHFDK